LHVVVYEGVDFLVVLPECLLSGCGDGHEFAVSDWLCVKYAACA
jgi:hypothetical protein